MGQTKTCYFQNYVPTWWIHGVATFPETSFFTEKLKKNWSLCSNFIMLNNELTNVLLTSTSAHVGVYYFLSLVFVNNFLTYVCPKELQSDSHFFSVTVDVCAMKKMFCLQNSWDFTTKYFRAYASSLGILNRLVIGVESYY